MNVDNIMTFREALDSIHVKEAIGDYWLKQPFAAAEIRRRFTQWSDYGAHFWTTEPKGSYGAAKCMECDRTVKVHYPWFLVKECGRHAGAAAVGGR